MRFRRHKKAAFVLLFFFILCVGAVLFIFGRGTPEGNALREMRLAWLRDYEAEGHDSHGGFHHDGTAFYQFTGIDPAQLEPLSEGKIHGWNPFPLERICRLPDLWRDNRRDNLCPTDTLDPSGG